MRGSSIWSTAAVILSLGMVATAHGAGGLSPHFQGRFGAIEIFDSQAKLSFRVNTPRLVEALPACGTGYLVVAAAALKQGTLKPDATTLQWDPVRYPAAADWPASWQRAQTLETALRYGTPWYFSELQAGLGAQLPAQLTRFGLKLAGNLIDGWRISALDQVDWLKKVRNNAIGLPGPAHVALLAALVRETNGSERLYGVGGRCAQDASYWLAWQVGWVDRGSAPTFYALNAEGKDRADLSGVGRRIALDTLTEMKLWRKTVITSDIPATAIATLGTGPSLKPAAPTQAATASAVQVEE